MSAKSKFTLGQAVVRCAFTDCFGEFHTDVCGLTVAEIRLIRCDFIPSYYRIKAVGPDGCGYVEAAESFFRAA